MNAQASAHLCEGINFIFHTIARGGGMERVVVDMICGFARAGVPVRGIAMRADISVFPRDLQDRIELVLVPARFPWIFSQRFSNLDFEDRALNFCRKGWKTVSASRVPVPVDMAISGGTHLAHLQKKGRKPSFADRKIMAHESAFYASAGVCIVHSQKTRNEILSLNAAEPSKIICLFPPANTEKFNLSARAEREKIRKEWGVSPGTCVLLFPSNDHKRKGLELILSALDKANFPDVILAVASRRTVNHPKVLNLGFRPDIEKCYAAADATILASRYEPFGLVGIESVLCGTPVLLSDECGATEVLAEPGCLKFSLETSSLELQLHRVRDCFHAGTLVLSEPEKSIRYPYSLEKHIKMLLDILVSGVSIS